MMEVNDFIEKITVPILEDNVAIFVGVGLSMASDFVSWKGVRGMASELGLDIDKEHDLIGIAQYYVNNILKPHA